jgi:hypothetical protein
MDRQHRNLRFETFEQALQEARRLASTPVTTSGSYSLGQILEHLARTLDAVTGVGRPLPVPWYAKLLGRFLRHSAIHRPARPGFKLPQRAQAYLWPTSGVSVEEGMQHLEKAAAAFLSIQQFPPHPLFGLMEYDQHHQLQCRHFELHLGFVHPADE